MKVALVSTLHAGGPLSYAAASAVALAGRGCDVKVICPRSPAAAALAAGGVEVTQLHNRHALDLGAVLRLRQEVAGCDIVHSHDRRAGLHSRALTRRRDAVAVHTLHGLPEEVADHLGPAAPSTAMPISARARLAAERALAHFGALVVPSAAMREFLLRSGFPAPIHVLPPAVAPRPARSESDRSRHVVGTACRLEQWKGVDVLIDACARLGDDAVLVVYGDGSRRRALVARAEARGVEAHFLGHVPDASDRIASLDVFVCPSRADNLPLSVLEAMAWGLPVIASDVGGLREIVEHGSNGVLVEAEDPGALATALAGLLEDSCRARSMGEAARRTIFDRFSPDAVASATLELYRSLAKGS